MSHAVRVLFLAIIMTFLASSAQAQQPASSGVDTSGLKAEQVKALNDLAIQLRREPENTLANLTLQNTTPDRFKEWADAGAAAGKAVSSFTKEIGIAADQFLQTDVGQIGLYALLWKFGGDKVIGTFINLLSGAILAIVAFTFWWKLTRRFVFGERRAIKIVYNSNTFLRWLGFNQKEFSTEKSDEWMAGLDNNDKFWITVWSRILSFVTLIILVFLFWPQVSF